MRPMIWSSVVVAAVVAVVGFTERPAAAHPKDASAKNKESVIAFYNLIFRDHKPAEAFERYGGDKYIQHNPRVPDGKDAVIGYFTPYFKANPEAKSEI
jgi:predicted SnoaL-like aldol condensation-catalyzing enzyme